MRARERGCARQISQVEEKKGKKPTRSKKMRIANEKKKKGGTNDALMAPVKDARRKGATPRHHLPIVR